MHVRSAREDTDQRGGRAPEISLHPHLALICAPTAGVRLFARRPPVHSILLGRAHVRFAGSVHGCEAIALPAYTRHDVLALGGPYACVAYLDPRRYGFAEVERLAHAWRRFVPGRDDLTEALGDALKRPTPRIDARLLSALDALDLEELTVAECARRARLSDSRLTHLMSETLGAPPRAWATWFKLRRAIRERLFGAATLTQAAHRAGFSDSAHLTRTTKQLTGVRPAQMLPLAARVTVVDG